MSVVCMGFFAGSTRSAATASTAPPVRPTIYGVQFVWLLCSFGTTAATCSRVLLASFGGVPLRSSGNDSLAARSSSRNRSCFVFRAAAPVRPAATFFGFFDGREATVTRSTGALFAGASNSTTLWLLLDAGSLFSIVFIYDLRRALVLKLAVLQCGERGGLQC